MYVVSHVGMLKEDIKMTNDQQRKVNLRNKQTAEGVALTKCAAIIAV